MRTIVYSVVFLIFLVQMSSSQVVDTLMNFVVADETMETEIDGCTCDAGYFLSDASGRAAWMNLGGKITRLTFIRSTDIDSAGCHSWFFVADDCSISIEFHPADRPHVGDESDVLYFTAIITVKKGSIMQVATVPGRITC